MAAKVPTMETGTASSGMIEARQVCRNRITTSTTSSTASSRVWTTALMESRTKHGGVIDDGIVQPLREILLQLLHAWRAHWSEIWMALEPGAWKIGIATACLVVQQRAQAILRGVDLHPRHIAQPGDHAAVVLDHDLAELLGIAEAAFDIDRQLQLRRPVP